MLLTVITFYAVTMHEMRHSKKSGEYPEQCFSCRKLGHFPKNCTSAEFSITTLHFCVKCIVGLLQKHLAHL